MNDLLPIVSSVLGVFLIIAVGAGCRHAGWLTQEADRSLTKLTTHILIPAYFFDQFSRSERLDSIFTAWQPPMFGFAFTAAGFFGGFAIARILGARIGLDDDDKQRAFAVAVGICNYGFIPLPLAMRFYPDAIVDLILHNVGVDLALWSIGVAILAGRGEGHGLSRLLSPPLMAVVVSIVFRQTGWHALVPTPLTNAIGDIGACAIPIGLILSGAILVDFVKLSASRSARPDHRPRRLWAMLAVGVLIRQGVIPLAMLATVATASVSRELNIVMMLQAAMPAAVFPMVLTKLYGRDTETSLRIILVTSLLGLVTIPAWLAIGAVWLDV